LADSRIVSKDIYLAEEVQQLLFPKSSPLCNWCCIGVKNRMAKGLGGDYFDFITMPDGCQVVFVGDVTGHGIHASVVMSLLYGYIHHSASGDCAPLDTVSKANAFLQNFAKRSEKYDYYFSSTIFYSIINPDTLMMHYVNAGHIPPLVRRGGKILRLGTNAQPIGFFDTPDMELSSFHFEREDRLFLYTDGIVEAANEKGEMFGAARLETLLLSYEGDHLEFLDTLFESLRKFGTVNPPKDDCTAIVIDFHSPFRSN